MMARREPDPSVRPFLDALADLVANQVLRELAERGGVAVASNDAGCELDQAVDVDRDDEGKS